MTSVNYTAYAFPGGEIGFAPLFDRGIPRGALFLASGEATKIVAVVTGLARHSYDGKTLLVPGCPEAVYEDDAYRAFCEFFQRVQRALGPASNLPEIRESAILKAEVDRRMSHEPPTPADA